tara:strand:- start:112 stop:390 length:279 start_codon:yes stop_codon:yes gene_type:complete
MNDYEKVQIEINESVTSDNFKEHLRKNYHNSYDEYLDDTRGIDLDVFYEKNSIPINEIVPKGMTIKEYFGKEQRLLRGENISYVKFDKDGYQ